jgi:CheY-like chemotaxis protein
MPAALFVDRSQDSASAHALLSSQMGLSVLWTREPVEALRTLRTNRVDIVLMEIDTGRVNGVDLIQAIRLLRPGMPVVAIVASEDHDQITRALELGATSYVPRQHLVRDLARTVHRLLSLTRIQRQEQQLLANLTETECVFDLENDPSLVQPIVHYLLREVGRMGWCEHGTLVRMGVALDEAISNAILHGNLEVSKELREAGDRSYWLAVNHRRQSPPYRDRRVHVCCRATRHDARFIVRDDGPGFKPTQVLATTLEDAAAAPAMPEQFSGRGLLLIRTFMDETRYNDRGNQVTMVKRRAQTTQAT